MRLFGLLGHPVGHSASPAMMNAAFRHDGIDAVYMPFGVTPEDITKAFEGLQALGASGVNVTIPHKQVAFEWVANRTPEAEQIGAVNTISFGADGATGHNTDVSGWWRSIADVAPLGKPRVTIIGAGGAAMAVVAAIATNLPDASLSVVSRRPEAGRAFQERFQRLHITAVPWDHCHDEIAGSQMVIQTTPIGMWPTVDDSPVADAGVFSPGQVVQDIVYRPRVTKFARMAAQRGATVVDGASMLVYQGVDAYEWWLGSRAPVDVMTRAVDEHLAKEHGARE